MGGFLAFAVALVAISACTVATVDTNGSPSAGFVAPSPLSPPLRRVATTSSSRDASKITMSSAAQDSTVSRRFAMAGISAGMASMVLAPASRCMAAAPNLDPRNAAGVGINSGNLGLSLKDIGGETPVEPLEEKKEPARMGQKPQAGSKAAGLAIFQDDNLGYAFAMPPSWKGQSNALDSGGQILAFVDDNNQGKTDALVTIVAQPTKLATIDELEKAIVPKGELISKKISVKDASQKDGSVIIFEANDKTKDLRVMALFSLRVQPTGNWLVSMTCQARGELYPSYINEFKDIIKGYRPTYSASRKRGKGKATTEIDDADLGIPDASAPPPKLDQAIMDMPFGGR